MRVNAEGSGLVQLRECVKGAERNVDFIADAVDVQRDGGWGLGGQSAGERGDHASRLGRAPCGRGGFLADSGNLLNNLVRNIEVGVHLLDIILIIQDFHQLQHLLSGFFVEPYLVLRNERHFSQGHVDACIS